MEKLPGKIKLGGADCFHLALDKHAKHHSAGGNVVRMAFFLDGILSKKDLQNRFSSIPVIHWLCNIKLVTPAFFRIPYWSYVDAGNEITIEEHFSDNITEIPESILNRDIGLDATCFIEADLIHCSGNKTIIVLSWNHILMDGRGSGMLTDFINNPTDSITLSSFFPKENKSPGWIAYMRNMYKVKHFIEQSSQSPIASVADGKEQPNSEFKFKIITFNQEQTKKIESNARKNGTRFGINSFLIAACSIATNKIIKAKGRTGNLWIPVPYDGRKRGAFGPVISNNVSSVFYTIPQKKLITTSDAVEHISNQMSEQLKIEMPKKYNMLQDMMRHIPSGLYYRLINRPGDGALASFLFTATGEGIGDLKTFFDLPVNDVIIFEPKTFPPGLTFLFLKFNNTLKVNISYATSIINSVELMSLENELRSIFLQD